MGLAKNLAQLFKTTTQYLP